MKYKLDGYVFKAPSKTKDKKYDAYDSEGNFIVSFGDKNYEQYYDKIGHYSAKNHNDFMRRKAYYLRHGRDAKYESAKWFSHNYLW